MQELNMALSNLDPSKSPGPDNIHGQRISRLSDWGKKSLLEIFNLSWRLGRLPRDWKKALIIPIRKSSKKASDPESFRPIALTNFSSTAMQIYTDGSKDDLNSCGSDIFIKAPNCSHNIKIRNPDFCSVFRSELIAIDEALRIIKTVTSPDEIWILCDRPNTLATGQMLETKHRSQFLKILKNFPSNTFSEIFSKTKSLIQELWKTPPTHPWYNRQAPGGALSIKADRVVQTTISRLASGHTRGLSFHLGQKIYENCTKCNLIQATPDHLLFSAGLDREDIYSSPLLVYDFLRTLGLMDLV
ncbi:RNase H domain-containing protein [Trichonephila clavipes]|uniref:RNase H domain-containing protein n=1 Tax=Trichonephila clavipes TaxID=2585209 RepID=A0A8X6SRP6_TRICX|nr:RNase H domain-containing protein [Trichonephila clavipes]